jgi:large subunit ribosomal protein L19e
MRLTVQRRIAGDVLGVSGKRVRFDSARLEDVKEAITRTDIRGLIAEGAVRALPEKGVSHGRARTAQLQRSKGRRKGSGSKKGTSNARANTKRSWINQIRLQREYVRELKDASLISKETARMLYGRSKGGFFRSKRHIKIYVEENGLLSTQVKEK